LIITAVNILVPKAKVVNIPNLLMRMLIKSVPRKVLMAETAKKSRIIDDKMVFATLKNPENVGDISHHVGKEKSDAVTNY
jgi:hypothetical protein